MRSTSRGRRGCSVERERTNVGDPRSLWHSMCGACNTVFHGRTEDEVLAYLYAHKNGRCPELQRVNREHGLQPHEFSRR